MACCRPGDGNLLGFFVLSLPLFCFVL
uniref:Uncharacterized protein n=1 Tax=Anguilla anguilla TaxID=7936 RepID=A0A0E9TY31_ANGAN